MLVLARGVWPGRGGFGGALVPAEGMHQDWWGGGCLGGAQAMVGPQLKPGGVSGADG